MGSVAWSGGAVGAVDATAVSSRARLLSEASCAARLAAAFAFQSAAREVGCESMVTLSLSPTPARDYVPPTSEWPGSYLRECVG